MRMRKCFGPSSNRHGQKVESSEPVLAETRGHWQRKVGLVPAVPQRPTLKQTEEAAKPKVGNNLAGNCH